MVVVVVVVNYVSVAGEILYVYYDIFAYTDHPVSKS